MTHLQKVERILALLNIKASEIAQFLRRFDRFVKQGEDLLFAVAELCQFDVGEGLGVEHAPSLSLRLGQGPQPLWSKLQSCICHFEVFDNIRNLPNAAKVVLYARNSAKNFCKKFAKVSVVLRRLVWLEYSMDGGYIGS